MDQRDLNSSVVIPNLAVLALVAIGFLAEKPPLTSTRPPAVSSTPRPDAAARLWEDPLAIKAPDNSPSGGDAALRKEYAAASKRSFDAGSPREAAIPVAATAGGLLPRRFRVLLMPVLLDEGRYPELQETRLRTRYAALSALARAQYVPTKPDRMQFVSLASASAAHLPWIPFEDFETRYLISDQVRMTADGDESLPPVRPAATDGREELRFTGAYDRVVVVWLPEYSTLKARERNAASALTACVGQLNKALFGDEKGEPPPFTVEVKVIGPTNTDRLVDLLSPDGGAVPADAAQVIRADFRPTAPPDPARSNLLLSARATASREVLQISLTRTLDGKPERPSPSSDAKRWELARTIATDDALVRAVLEELQRRGAGPSATRHIALVGEWDTIYSRGIGRSFAAALNANGSRTEYLRLENWSSTPAYLHEFSYLRGLDGRTGTAKADKDDPAGAAEGAPHARLATSATRRDPERAAGESQFDYLRRIEGQLTELQRSIATTTPGAEIRAIGIIGSDTYDKLLVLRALRASFPRALFFTTDLDAIYLDRSEDDYTTNLIIAAPFGLTVHQALQGRIPPFRDSYQAALYLTVLNATGLSRVGANAFVLNETSIQPRLFEVGRNRFRDLSAPENPSAGDALLHPKRATPPKTGGHPGLVIAFVTLALGAAAGWAWLARPFTREEATRMGFLMLWLVTVIGLVALDVERHGRPTWTPGVIIVLTAIFAVLYTDLCRGPAVLFTVKSASRPGILPFTWAAFFLLAGTGIVVVCFALYHVAADWNEEPFAWFDGLSIWPTNIVRLGVALVAVVGVTNAQRRLDEMKAKITTTEEYGLSYPEGMTFQWSLSRPLQTIQRWWLARPIDRPTAPSERDWWVSYCLVTTPPLRLPRVIICTLLYLLIFLLLSKMFGNPIVPARGEWSRALDTGILAAAVLAYTYLLFFVLDVTIMASALIARFEDYIGKPSQLADGRAVHVIDDLTSAVATLIYLPFTALFMMIVSRNKLFDSWDWPPLLLGIFGTGLVLIMFAALLLQQRARRARQKALESIDEKILNELIAASSGTQAPANEAAFRSRETTLRELRAQIMAFDGVAFQRWHHNPIFRALLIPIGGFGSLELLDKLGSIL